MQKIKTESSPDLTHVVCELSFASDLDSIMRIVRESVRNYTGADGVTFVLREGDTCFYADEEAIEPLWKGQRFPLSQCISGWVMEHKESAIIRDIYADKRIPHDVYRPTFVKSLFMVPIRSADPLGAIGVYWAKEYLPSSEEQAYLRAVADTTAVAVENVRINNMLKQQVRELSEERRRFEGIIEGTHAGTWEWNVQTGEVVFNDIWAGMLGYELSELSPMSIKTWEALVHPEDLGQAKVLLQRHFSGDQDFYKCEYRMKHKNGSWIWVFDRGEVLTRTAEGKPLLMFGTHIDITERKRVELRNVQLNRVLEGIRNVNKTIAREKNPGRLLEESCRLLCDSQGFYNVWIATFNSVEADALNTSSLSSVRGCYSHGFDDGFEVMRNWLSKANVPSCVIQALDRHDVVCVVDPHASCTDCPLAPSYNGRSGLTVKLAHNNRVYGWLNASVPSEYSGDSEEHALLQGVAEDLGHALYSLEMEKQRTIAERAYADMVAVTTDAIIGCDVDGAIDLFNNGAEKLYGCDANSVLGASITRFCPDSLTYEQEQLLERARKEGCVGPVETERISADGKTVSVEMTITVRRDENGVPEGFVGIIRDITLRKKTEQDLKRQAQIIAQVHDSIVITDTEGCITGFNEGAEKLHGYTPDEIMGKDVGILFPPEYRNMFREVVLKELKDNDAHHLEIPMISKSGKEIHVHLSLSLLKDAYGAAIGTIGYALDITDRKKMEKQIEEWQSLFEYIIRYDPNAIAVLDKNLRYLFVSDRFKKDYQVRDQDIIGKHQYDVFPDTPQKWREVHRRALKGEILGQDEDYFPRLNGTEDWTRWECRPWFASGGEVGGIVLYTEVITERKKAEIALRKSEEHLRITLNSIGDAVIVTDTRGQVKQMNPLAEKLTGYTINDAQGRLLADVFNIINSKTRQPVESPVHKVLATGAIVGLANHTMLIARDGAEYQIADSGAPIRDDKGAVVGVVLVFRDVTREYAMQEKIAASQAQFAAFMDNLPGYAYIKDRKRRHVFINTKLQQFFGLGGPDNWNNKTIEEILSFPEPEEIRLNDEKLFASGVPLQVEENISVGGETRSFLSVKFPISIENQPEYLGGISIDISDRIRAEKALKESEQRFHDLFEKAPLGYQSLDSEGRFIEVNRAWLDTLGYSAEEVIGKRFEDFLAPEYAQAFKERFPVFKAQGRILSEFYMFHKDGSRRYIVFNGRIGHDRDGHFKQTHGILRDETERKQMEQALRENEALLKAALDNSYAGIVIADAPDGKLRYANEAALRIRGKSKKEVVEGIGIQEYVESWQICRLDGTLLKEDEIPLARAILYGETCSKEFIIRRDDGEQRVVLANAAPIHGSDGTVTAGIVIFLDITENKRLNERLRQAEKMESIGTLAGGIAHDFNNILGGIIGYADLSLDYAPSESLLANNLQRILQGGDRAKNLVRQILNFSRRDSKEKSPQYLRPVIKEVVELLRASLPSSINIESNLERDTSPVLCDPTQIHEIVMNLCANAAHSMKNEKGLLQVLYEEIAFEKEIQGRAGTVAPGMYSVITVRDNGRGMDSDTLERIFEPFFTTKSQGEGTGMGLAVVFGIVQSHGGTITAESMLGKGSTFRVYLPKSEKQHDGEVINDNTPVQRGTERILFIDDEEAISEMVKDILTNLGYVVTVFNEPLRAVEVFADGPDQFDLVITDQTMPGLTGMELVHRIREIKSDVSIILSTGYSRLIDEEKALAAGIDGFLSKPFRRRIIAHKIREVLERRNNL